MYVEKVKHAANTTRLEIIARCAPESKSNPNCTTQTIWTEAVCNTTRVKGGSAEGLQCVFYGYGREGMCATKYFLCSSCNDHALYAL